MALTPPKVIDIDDPLRARGDASPPPTPTRPAPPRARSRAVASAPTEPAAPEIDDTGNQGDPYDGSPKVAVSMRATKELWDRLGVLSRRLEDEGLRTSRTELTEALWHFHAPQSTFEARELVLRYRRARLG